MVTFNIPGKGSVRLNHIVLDFNGTIARDGVLIDGVKERLNKLAEQMEVHIVTADTFGFCQEHCKGIKSNIHILTAEVGSPEKLKITESLAVENVAAVGNGVNDALMLKAAALGIVVIGPEGASIKALREADVIVKDINDGLDLLLNPKRLIATLRE